MKNILISVFAVLISAMWFSCSQSSNTQSNQPKSLLKEIDLKAELNTLSSKEAKKGWQLLFNGKDFAGWHGFNMNGIPECWIIEDNSLTMTTVGGAESQDIITDKKYKHFALSLEYKVTKAANSGILFQVSEDTAYKFPYETGPEFQVIDQAGWPDSLAEWQISGANYAMHPPAVKPYKPVGEWNHAILVVNSNRVTFFLNGEMTVDYTKYSAEWKALRESGKWSNFPDYGKFDTGHISLQNHGSKVWYRNIKLKELTGKIQ